MQEITVTHNDAGRRIDNYLLKVLPGGGLSFFCKMLRKKNITVNGKRTDGSYKLSEGDVIRIFFSDETYNKLRDKNRQISGSVEPTYDNFKKAYDTIKNIGIVYEDEDFIFIDKPAGVLSQMSDAGSMSVNEWLAGYLLEKGDITPDSLKTFTPAFANRLDRNTSGLMLGAKSLGASQLLGKLLRDRNLHKYYRCMAEGMPDDRLPVNKDGYTDIYAYLIKDHGSNTVKVFPGREKALEYVNADDDRGARGLKNDGKISAIHTGFKLIELTGEGAMLLEVKLYTGKSHQIRAQLASLGHPIVGDPKYGKSGKGQMLHAYRVVFPRLPEWPSVSEREFCTNRTGF